MDCKRRSSTVRTKNSNCKYKSLPPLLRNENSARSFSDRSFFEPPRGHGRPRLRVMDVRTEMLVFPGFRGFDRSFCPRTSAGISARTSAGYPAPKLTLWAAFSFLNFNPHSDGVVIFTETTLRGTLSIQNQARKEHAFTHLVTRPKYPPIARQV